MSSPILNEKQIREAYEQFAHGSGLPSWNSLTDSQRQEFRLRSASHYAECQK